MNHGEKYKNISPHDFVFCLATSTGENVIISTKFDKHPELDHNYKLYFGLYTILLFVERSKQRPFV